MATLLQAIGQYGPRITYNPTIGLDEAASWMSMRTGLNKSEVMMVLQEMNELILYYNQQGTPVKLPGVGTFRPVVNRAGKFKIGFRADTELRNGINAPGAFTGPIDNRANIGIENEDLKVVWDADHPDDPLDL